MCQNDTPAFGRSQTRPTQRTSRKAEGHVAADMMSGIDCEFCIVYAHAAKCCEFANNLAKTNQVNERLTTDVKLLDDAWAITFIEKAKTNKSEVILTVAGFQCKEGLSRQRGQNNPNLQDRQSALFEEIPRVRTSPNKMQLAASST